MIILKEAAGNSGIRAETGTAICMWVLEGGGVMVGGGRKWQGALSFFFSFWEISLPLQHKQNFLFMKNKIMATLFHYSRNRCHFPWKGGG